MKVFVGYDTREDIAYQVCKHSILRRQPNADVFPIVQKDLRESKIYTRPVDPLSSTEFTFTRYLVPDFMSHSGWALFIDSDTIVMTDIKELFDQADDKYAVMCVKHEYNPKETIKMDCHAQLPYPRKNWSSVMLFNCGHPSNEKLTMDLINDNSKDGLYFHQMQWLKDEEIGSLHHTWNYLNTVYDDLPNPNIVHYTAGGPWFKRYRKCKLHDMWKKELFDMLEETYED